MTLAKAKADESGSGSTDQNMDDKEEQAEFFDLEEEKS